MMGFFTNVRVPLTTTIVFWSKKYMKLFVAVVRLTPSIEIANCSLSIEF
jgi:hypothetical protein